MCRSGMSYPEIKPSSESSVPCGFCYQNPPRHECGASVCGQREGVGRSHTKMCVYYKMHKNGIFEDEFNTRFAEMSVAGERMPD